jgi:uncharacterized protein (TIGR02145 family)
MTGKSNMVQMVAAALLLVSCVNERNYESYLAPESDAGADAIMADGTGDIARGDLRLSELDQVGDLLVDVRDVYDLEILPEIDVGDCVPECDDGDPCNGVETCNLETGECETGKSVVCDDALSCNGLESCAACPECPGGYECLVEDGEECDDGNPCTVDSCSTEADEKDALTGCLYVPLDDGIAPEGECDDQNPCTFDNCLEGGCDNPVKPLEELGDDVDMCVCTSDDDCLALDDQVRCNGTFACLAAPEPPEEQPDLMLCQVDPETVPDCAALDAIYCNGQESCAECPECEGLYSCEAGEPLVLDDGIACTTDECDEEVDEVVHILMDGPCNDNNVCTADLCDPTADGADEDSGCVYAATQPAEDEETVACIPDDLCEVNGICDETVCAGENLSALSPEEHEAGCNDGNVCTKESCGVVDDAPACSYLADPDVTDCEDGDLCTVGDVCVDTVCMAGPPPACDDQVACTLDGCDLVTGDCTHLPVVIDDDDPCTTDECDSESGEITHAPVDHDDGLYCNGVESCDPQTGGKVAGVAPPEDDQVDCTADTCDEENDVVVHLPVDVNCADQTYCDGTEICDAVGDCMEGLAVACDDDVDCTEDSCDEDQEGCKFEPDDGLCADEVTCTIDEVCDVDSGCDATLDHEFCDDGNDCTDDVCDPEDGCLHTTVQDGGDCVLSDPCYINPSCQEGICAGDFDLENCGDFDHDGIAGDADVCPYSFDPGNPAENSIEGTDACEDLSAHGTFSYQRELALSQEGETSQWRRTHEPVEIPLANGIIDDSVVGYWKLDGDALDATGKYGGTNHGALPALDRFGDPGGAMAFDDLSQTYIDIDGAAVAATGNPDAGLTVSFWFKADELSAPDDDSGVLAYFARSGSSGLEVMLLQVAKTGNIYAALRNAGGTPVGSNVPFDDTQDWHHVALRFDNAADVAQVYLDGKLGVTFACESLHTAVWGTIGAARMDKYPDGVHFFDGSIDDLAIFERAMAPDEIETYYRSNAPYGTSFVPGAQADFDDVRVTEVGDDGKEFVKRSRVIGPRPHSDTACTMDEDDGTWASRNDLCGVEAYWKFDGTLQELLSASLGSAIGNPKISAGRFGDPGGSQEFDGVDDGAEIWQNREFLFGESFTVEFWVLTDQASDPSGGREFLMNASGKKCHDCGLAIGLNHLNAPAGPNRLHFQLNHDGSGSMKMHSESLINDGAWHHISVVRSFEKAWLYFDGQLEDEATDAGIPPNFDGGNPLTIMNTYHFPNKENTAFGKGMVDEVIIHSVAKSPDYIYHRANPGVPKLRLLASSQVQNGGTEENPSYPLRDYALHWGNPTATVVAPLVKSLDEQKTCYGLLSECLGYAGWWRFNEGSGTTAVDSSGNKNNAVVQGVVGRGPGMEGVGVVLSGTSNAITVPHSPDFDLQTFTLELAAQPEDVAADGEYLLAKMAPGPHDNYAMLLKDSKFRFQFEYPADEGGTGDAILTGGQPQSGKWTWVSGQFDGAGMSVFHENEPVGSYVPPAGPYTDGETPLTMGHQYSGMLDDVRIMNRALKPDEFLHYPLVFWGLTTLLGTDGKPLDSDGDGIGDDGDDSGIIGDHPCVAGQTDGCDDNAPAVENADQADDDADGVGQIVDNCLDDKNPDQADVDMDGLGDACDAEFTDLDHDGVLEGDLCPYSFDPGNPDGNGIAGQDGCEKLNQHGVFEYQRELTLSQAGEASQWRRTHEPVEIPLANGIIDDSVVGYWKLDGDLTTAFGAPNGQEIGAPVAAAGAFVDVSGALEFDGQDDGARLWANRDFRFGKEFTVSAWVKTDFNGNQHIATTTSGDKCHDNGWGLYFPEGGTLGFIMCYGEGCGTGNVASALADFPMDGAWHQVTGVNRKSQIDLFIDGTLVASTPHAEIPESFDCGNAVMLGHTFHFTDQATYGHFNGAIDDFTLHDRALSPDEIESYYRSKAPYGTSFVPGAQADFDDLRVTEIGDDGKEFVKRSRVIGPRPHSDTPCPMEGDDGTWDDRDDLCGVVGYWPLDGNTTEWTADHESSAIGEPAASTGRFGDTTGSMSFNGEDDGLFVWQDREYEMTKRFTIELWARTSTETGCLIKTDSSSKYSKGGAKIRLDNGIPSFTLPWLHDKKITVVGPTRIDDGQWHHLAAIRREDGLEFYVDGQLAASADGSAIQDPFDAKNKFAVMHCYHFIDNTTYSGWMDGAVDEILVHSVAKSPDYIYHRANPGMPKLRFLGNTQVQNAGTEESPSYPLRDYALHWGNQTATVVAPLVKSLDEQKTCYGLLSGCTGYAGWWRFNEGSGDVAMDSSTYANSGQLAGDVSWAAGLEGTGVVFDGNHDFIEIAGVETVGPDPGATQEASFFPDMIDNDNNYVLSKYLSYNCYLNANDGGAGNLAYEFSTSGDSCALGGKVNGEGSVPPVGAWSTVAAAFDGAQGVSYFNHEVDSTKLCSGSVTANDNPVLVGQYSKSDSNGGFVGVIDSVRIMNRALASDEFLHFPLLDWKMGSYQCTPDCQGKQCGDGDGCGGSCCECGEVINDSRDSNTYQTVQIGAQCWMAENLAYDNGCSTVQWENGSDEGWCGSHPECVSGKGLLYQWSAMMTGGTNEGAQGICPVGWHIPTDQEWCTLRKTLGSDTPCDHVGWGWNGTGTAISLGGSSGYDATWPRSRECTGEFLPCSNVTHKELAYSSSECEDSSQAWTGMYWNTDHTDVWHGCYDKCKAGTVRCIMN